MSQQQQQNSEYSIANSDPLRERSPSLSAENGTPSHSANRSSSADSKSQSHAGTATGAAKTTTTTTATATATAIGGNANNSSSSTGGASYISTDPVKTFLRDKKFPEKPKLMKVSDVKINFDGLRILAEQESWREVAKLCEQALSLSYPPHEAIQYRLSLVVANLVLRIYDPVTVQLDSLGNLVTSAAYFYQTYSSIYKQQGSSTENSNYVGNFAPFSLELLQALSPSFTDNQVKALDQLYRLLHRCSREISQIIDEKKLDQMGYSPQIKPNERILRMKPLSTREKIFDHSSQQTKKDSNLKKQETSAEDRKEPQRMESKKSVSNLNALTHSKKIPLSTWKIREQRVLLLIVNCHIMKKEYRIGLQILEKTLSNYQITSEDPIQLEQYTILLSMLGCLYLQCGVIPEASKYFVKVEKVLDADTILQAKGAADADLKSKMIRIYMNRGYLQFAQGQYLTAYEQFQQCIKLDPQHITAANNRAICLLYTCNLSKAIESLEDVIRSDPTKTLDETLLYNLFTLYDLEGDNSIQKKRLIHNLLIKFKGEDIAASLISSVLKI